MAHNGEPKNLRKRLKSWTCQTFSDAWWYYSLILPQTENVQSGMKKFTKWAEILLFGDKKFLGFLRDGKQNCDFFQILAQNRFLVVRDVKAIFVILDALYVYATYILQLSWFLLNSHIPLIRCLWKFKPPNNVSCSSHAIFDFSGVLWPVCKRFKKWLKKWIQNIGNELKSWYLDRMHDFEGEND